MWSDMSSPALRGGPGLSLLPAQPDLLPSPPFLLPGPPSFPARQSLWGISLGETPKNKESDSPFFQMGKRSPIYSFTLSPNSLLRAYYVTGSVLGIGEAAGVLRGGGDKRCQVVMIQ